MMPGPDDARMAALRRQQMIGQLGMIGDIPGVQQSAKSLVDSANREIIPPGQGFNQMMAMLAMQNQGQDKILKRSLAEEAKKENTRRYEIARDEKMEEKARKGAAGFNKRVDPEIIGLGQTFKTLKNLLGSPGGVSGGDVAGIGWWDSRKPGIFSNDVTKEIRSNVAQLRNQMIKLAAGTAVSHDEMTRINEGLAQLDAAGSDDMAVMAAIDKLREAHDIFMDRAYKETPPESLDLLGLPETYKQIGPLLGPGDEEIIDLPSRM